MKVVDCKTVVFMVLFDRFNYCLAHNFLVYRTEAFLELFGSGCSDPKYYRVPI